MRTRPSFAMDTSNVSKSSNTDKNLNPSLGLLSQCVQENCSHLPNAKPTHTPTPTGWSRSILVWRRCRRVTVANVATTVATTVAVSVGRGGSCVRVRRAGAGDLCSERKEKVWVAGIEMGVWKCCYKAAEGGELPSVTTQTKRTSTAT